MIYKDNLFINNRMTSKEIDKIDEIIKIFKSTDDYELEVKYDSKISKEDFDKIINFYKSQRLTMSNSTTLDIIFENNKINYRITIDENQIKQYASNNKLTTDMIKEFLVKEKLKGYKPLLLADYNLKFNLKIEKQVTDETLVKKLLSVLSRTLKGFRYKIRTSFISKNGLLQYDFTIVKAYKNAKPKEFVSNKKFLLEDLSEDEDYELEIEVKNKKITGTEFLDKGIELYKLLNPTERRRTIDRRSIKSDDNDDEEDFETTMKWMLPNRIGYGENVFKNFRPESYYETTSKLSCKCDGEVCDIASKSLELYPQQRLIKDYVQLESPYRGALLYHELGSGKSGASIAAAEGYINKKRMFVMSPASLAVNYENEILKISSIGLNLKKDWKLVQIDKTDTIATQILFEKYAISKDIIKKDSLVWIPIYEDDIPNATIVKRNVTEADKPLINMMISHIIRNRYTFISYNGLNDKLLKKLEKEGFNNSFVIIDEVHNFASRIVNGSSLARRLYLKLMEAKNCRLILLSGTPIINNPYEIATIVNLIRGYMCIYEIPYLPSGKLLSDNEFTSINATLMSTIDDFHIDNQKKRLLITLLPYNYKKMDNSTIIEKKRWGKDEDNMIKTMIDNVNSIKRGQLANKPNKLMFSALPNTLQEFNSYFLDMTDDENPKIKNDDLFMRRILGTISYYSISGSELFPKRLDDITRYLEMSDTQFKKYAEVRAIERKMDMKKGGVMDDKSSVYRAFSRMVCNFSFPENIERVYPNDIKKALKVEMDEEETRVSIEEESEIKKVKAMDVYENKLNEAIQELTDGNLLTYDNVEKELSPKFAAMYNDIITSPGSVLVYSQFRTVEGLGLFSEFLNTNGFKEIDFKKVGNNYQLTDPNVFNERYNDKRYVIFSADKDKTKILMNLFNGDFKSLPPKIAKALPEDISQLYGKLVKIFCITASGAEGISLKNVRRVLITEPYWNNIRIEQVIGRAIRSCSHEALPLADRDVTVYRYIMKFTKKQLDKDFTIQTLDKGISTDEHILTMANKKMAIVTNFLKMLKAGSFDCVINSKQNKPLKNGYKCYNWALGVNNNDLSYTNDIKDDYKIMKHKGYQIARKNRGKVIIKNGVKYVEMNGKIYNYYSYVNAGILIPEEI